jgi:hypothetical protein
MGYDDEFVLLEARFYVARMGEKRNLYRMSVGKPEGKRPLGDQDVGGWTIQMSDR